MLDPHRLENEIQLLRLPSRSGPKQKEGIELNTQKFNFTTDPETGFLREDDARKYFSTFGWFCFVLCLATFVVSEAIYTIFYMIAPTVFSHYLFGSIASSVIIYAIAFPIALPILKKLPCVAPLSEKVKPSTVTKGFFASYAIMYVGNLVSVYLIQFIQMASGNSLSNPLAETAESMPTWAIILFTVILAPVLEEIFFRGIVCRRLLALGEGFAIIFSGAFFALFHGNLYQVFYAFTLGCFFALIYIRTGKLIYSILYHAFINFMGMVVSTLITKFVRIDEILNIMTSEETIEAIANGDASIIMPYMTDILIMLAYSFVIYGILIAGIVIIISSHKKIKLEAGLLPPPKKSRANIIFLNGGIAAAIIILVLQILLSLLL